MRLCFLLTFPRWMQKIKEHEEISEQLKQLRLNIRSLEGDFDQSEEDIKALQSAGQTVGEVLRQLTEDRCQFSLVSLPCTSLALT